MSGPVRLRSLIPRPGRRRRRVWVGAGKAHIEVRGADGPAHGPLASELAVALQRIDSVHWAELHGPTGRLVVAFEEGAGPVRELIAVVEEVEAATGVGQELFPEGRPDHPGDWEPVAAQLVALAADSAALGLAIAGRAARLARLPMEVASLVPLVQAQPRLQHLLEARLGSQATHLTLAVGNAAVQAMAQGPLGPVVDAGVPATLATEAQARRRAWEATEARLCPGFADAPCPPPEVVSRPVPLPPGPVEQFVERAGIASLGAFGASLLATRDVRRSAAVFFAGTPKAATLGREAFAAHLGRLLSARGVVAFDAGVLRRLDRIDCVVLDRSVLGSPAVEIDRVVLVAASDQIDAERMVAGLFDPERPDRVRRRGEWRLGPLDRLRVKETAGLRRARLELGESGSVLGLARGGRLVAIARIAERLDPVATSLIAAARAGGHMVVGADVGRDLADRLGVDLFVDGGDRLAASVRMLQDDGCGVLLVTVEGDDALRAADCGLAVSGPGRRTAWGADVVCPTLAGARFVVEATTVAHEASRQSVALSLGGSSAGALLAFTGPPWRAAQRAVAAVNTAALLALANGTRAAVSLGRRPEARMRTAPAWHSLRADAVLQRLRTSQSGLGAEEAARRRRPPSPADGPPALPAAVLEELLNPFTPVLGAAVGLSTVAGSVVDAALISAVAAVNALLGGVQRHHVEHAVRALEASHTRPVRVIRDGKVETVVADDVVPGDLLALEAGDSVPADCRIVEARSVEVDESSLTGESMPVRKRADPTFASDLADRSSMLYGGTAIAAGSVRAVVVGVGEDTEMQAAAVGETRSAGGVEARLRELTRVALPATIAAGGALGVLGALRGTPMVRSLQAGTSLAVAAVPEGLPLLATAAQLSAARRLASRGALVRNARSVEALGRVDVLCTDKTGTLTEGRIALRAVSDGRRDRLVDHLTSIERSVLATGLRASPHPRSGRLLPHPTDRAVVDGAAAAAVGPNVGAEGWRVLADLPFEPTRGYHAALGETAGHGRLLSAKGAPEIILPRCDGWRPGGIVEPLDDRGRQRVERTVDRLARRGFRVLAVAEREASSRADLEDARVSRLNLVGLLALADPVRATASESVSRLQAARVRVVMVTGDHPSTAAGIAGDLGILNGRRVLTGAELDDLDDAALDAILDDVSVFARVTPAQKVRIVTAYQRQGRAVAMTGDGANDAPAIRLADIGVALGEHATAAARRSADVVVPDGRIETLIEAIVEGRAMWASVRDALALLLGGNLGEVAFTVVGAVVSGKPPLSPRQLLLVNLLTDGLPALAIASRPPANRSPDQLLREGPEASLGRPLERAILDRAAVTALGATGAWLLGAPLPPRQRSTAALVSLVGTQLAQTALSGTHDRRVVLTSVGSAAALALLVQTPGVSQFFGCAPLGPVGWSVAVGSAVAATAVGVAAPNALRALVRIDASEHGGRQLEAVG